MFTEFFLSPAYVLLPYKIDKSNRQIFGRGGYKKCVHVCLCVLIYNASCQRSGMILDVMHVRYWSSQQLKTHLDRRGQIILVYACGSAHAHIVCAYISAVIFQKELNACGCAIINLLCQTKPLYGRYSVMVGNYMRSGKVRAGNRWNCNHL